MGRRHGMWLVTISHFACWLNIESMMWDERFVAVEQAVPTGQHIALEPARHWCSESISTTRPTGPGARLAMNSAFHCLSVVSNTPCSRFEAVSSGIQDGKLSGLRRITSVSHWPSTRVRESTHRGTGRRRRSRGSPGVADPADRVCSLQHPSAPERGDSSIGLAVLEQLRRHAGMLTSRPAPADVPVCRGRRRAKPGARSPSVVSLLLMTFRLGTRSSASSGRLHVRRRARIGIGFRRSR